MKEKNIKVDNLIELEDIIVDSLSPEKPVSFVADFEKVWKVAMDLHRDGFEFEYISVDKYDYNREYVLTIYNSDNLYTMSLEEAYNTRNGVYVGVDGLVYIDDMVNSKFITDVCNNNFVCEEFEPVIVEFVERHEAKTFTIRFDDEDFIRDVSRVIHLIRDWI